MNSVVTTYYFAGGAYEVQENGATETVRKYYSFAGMAVAMQSCTAADCSLITANWTLVYFLTDHLGSVAAVTDDTGVLLSEQRYLPFGEVREDVSEITQTDFAFTGQRSLDQQGTTYSLGLMDYNARFYDSYLNRWTQPDSIIPDGNPQSLNRFTYVNNSPINFNDPSGHGPCSDLPDTTRSQCENGLKNSANYLKFYMKQEYNWNFADTTTWTVTDLQNISQAGQDISNVIGAGNFRKLFGNVLFDKKVMDHPGETDPRDIGHVWLRANGDWSIWAVVHELGHTWDFMSGEKNSKALVLFTGGRTDPAQGKRFQKSLSAAGCTDSQAVGCNIAGYYYGGIPPKGSDENFNRREDFAESFAALVDPSQALHVIQSDTRFKYKAYLQYNDYLTTPRGMWVSALVYTETHP